MAGHKDPRECDLSPCLLVQRDDDGQHNFVFNTRILKLCYPLKYMDACNGDCKCFWPEAANQFIPDPLLFQYEILDWRRLQPYQVPNVPCVVHSSPQLSFLPTKKEGISEGAKVSGSRPNTLADQGKAASESEGRGWGGLTMQSQSQKTKKLQEVLRRHLEHFSQQTQSWASTT